MNAPNEPYGAVIDVLTRYYEGLYRCDTALLAGAFHPAARYYTASSGELLYLDMDGYLPQVARRTPPQANGEPYAFEIESIEFAGPVTALARLTTTLWSKRFTDLLTLVRLDGEWRIVAKVFHFDHADETG